jgi:hypothetical protein
VDGRARPTSCPGLPPDSPSSGGQAANWDSTVVVVELVVGEVRVSMRTREAVKIRQKTEGTGSTSPAVRKIQTRAFAVWRRQSAWRV